MDEIIENNGLLTVLPVIRPDTGARCVSSVLNPEMSSGLSADELLIVDNTKDGWDHGFPVKTYRDPNGHNLGVARAWNVGAREVLERGLDYLVVLSASVEFGPLLHCTWKSQMEEFWGRHVIEALGHSWHLIAFHRSVFETVGLFDENFYPAYFEAIDFGYRMKVCGVVPDIEPGLAWADPVSGLEQYFARPWVNAMSWGTAQHIVVDVPADPLLAYYRKKWGGDKGHEKWTMPFNRKTIDWFPTDTIPVLADRYHLKDWW